VIGVRERSVLDAIPSMHPDAECLLAGLTARLTCWHKEQRWAVSRLVHDDIAGRQFDCEGWTFLHLWGEDAEWILRWSGYGSVPAADVARAFTHEIVGLPKATAEVRTADRAELRLGRATLVLERHHTADYLGQLGLAAAKR
jgi:hypothetical protein